MKLVLLLVLICLGTGIAALVRTLTIPVRKSDYKPQQGDPHSSGITRFWHRCFRWCTRGWRS